MLHANRPAVIVIVLSSIFAPAIRSQALQPDPARYYDVLHKPNERTQRHTLPWKDLKHYSESKKEGYTKGRRTYIPHSRGGLQQTDVCLYDCTCCTYVCYCTLRHTRTFLRHAVIPPCIAGVSVEAYPRYDGCDGSRPVVDHETPLGWVSFHHNSLAEGGEGG